MATPTSVKPGHSSSGTASTTLRGPYGPKSNLLENFDPLIGSRHVKTAPWDRSSTSAEDTASFERASDIIVDTSRCFVESSTALASDTVAVALSPSSSSHSRTVTPLSVTMVVGPFPPLTSVHEIREFDDTTDKLTDFLISVESHLAAYTFPIVHGGYITGDIDIGWTYATDANYQAAPHDYKPNFDFEKRFCILLAERFTGAARN